MSGGRPRTADPFRDTDVVDQRAPRVNQAAVGVVALLGVVFGWPLAWAIMAGQLLIGLVFGRQYCLPCLAYFVLIQPRFGEGPLEDARPPRFATLIGFVFLTAAAASWWLGAETAGLVLGSIVAFLALLAAGTGLCAGCTAYRLSARLRGIGPRNHARIDLADLGATNGYERTYAVFTHPLCAHCREWEVRLLSEGEPVVKLDVKKRPELARKYGVVVVPTVLAVDSEGVVLERLAP